MKSSRVFLLVFLSAFTAAEAEFQRIVSLVPSLTHELYLLQHDPYLVGCTTFCRIPDNARTKAKIGTVLSLSLEKILSLKPDLILAGDYLTPRYRAKLRQLDLNTVFFATPRSYREIRRGFLKLAGLLGKSTLGTEYVQRIDLRLKKLADRSSAGPPVTLCFLLGTRPLFWVADGSYLNDCIEYAGGENPLRDYPGGRVSREEVIRLNPQVIVIADMGPGTAAEKAVWQSFQGVSAARKKRIFIVDPDLFCLPSIQNFYLSAVRLRQLITGVASSQHAN